jgi:hypothetical protein
MKLNQLFCFHLYLGLDEYINNKGWKLYCLKCEKEKYTQRNFYERIMRSSKESRDMLETYLKYKPYRLPERIYSLSNTHRKLLEFLIKYNNK